MAVLTAFPGDGTPSVVVELHDVAPPFEARIRAQLEILAAMGIERSVLYVVPNWHGAYPLAGSPSFVRLLRQQHEAGSELVLHGLEHQQRGPLRGPAQLRVRAGLFARGVAEFLSLTAPEVARGMQHARERFEALDLPAPSTFCAPGWLLAPDVTEALAAEGICRVAGMVSLIDLERSRQYLLPSLGYMGGGTIHETAISLSNRLVRLALPELSAVQTYLHPQGSMESPAARAVVRTVQQLVANGRRPATFEDLLPAQAAGP